MKYRINVAFIVDDEGEDEAEAQLEGQLCDMMNSVGMPAVEDFQIMTVQEIEEEEE